MPIRTIDPKDLTAISKALVKTMERIGQLKNEVESLKEELCNEEMKRDRLRYNLKETMKGRMQHN